MLQRKKESFLAPGSLQGCLLLHTGCPLTLLQPNSQTRTQVLDFPVQPPFHSRILDFQTSCFSDSDSVIQ